MREDNPIVRQLLRGWQQPGWLNWLCLPLSGLYGVVMRLRHELYRQGLLTVMQLPVPVIVVGNLSVGGTGKSPLVLALSERLTRSGWRPGIVSRGYGGGETDEPMVVQPQHTAAQTGDEPKMLAVGGSAPVAVGRDRAAAARLLIDNQDCNLIISDDGFQHLHLARDIDILVVDGQRGLGNGWPLPAGPLREFRSARGRADLRVVNGEQGCEAPGFGQGEVDFFMQVRPQRVRPLLSGEPGSSLKEFADQHEQVVAMAGLGSPQRFFDSLTSAGMSVQRIALPDHHPFSAADFAGLASDLPVVITEKDAVKCQMLVDSDALDASVTRRIYVLGVVAQLHDDFYDAVIRILPAAPVAP